MAKIRHVAMMVKDAKRLRDFYVEEFGFEECYHSASDSYMVTDGLFNLALLKIRQNDSPLAGTHRADGGEADQRPGINHFGFVVDNVEEALERAGSELVRGQTPQDGRPAEMRVHDPWGNKFDLSARGYFGREEKRLPAIRRVIHQAEQPAEVAAFFRERVGLNDEGTGPDGTTYLGDGHIHLEFLPKPLLSKPGIQAIGIQVDDWATLAQRFAAMNYSLPRPGAPDGEIVVNDPEGNLLFISQIGWNERSGKSAPTLAGATTA